MSKNNEKDTNILPKGVDQRDIQWMSRTAMNIRSEIQKVTTDWKEVLINILDKNPKIEGEINDLLTSEYKRFKIYPPRHLIFNALNHFNISDLKVAIIGQDPYINPGEAMGLAFSVPEGCKMPPSLRNIFNELEREFGEKRESTDLTDWVKQGVLLLNTALTVKAGESGSHCDIWCDFTNEVMEYIGRRCQGVVFMLWGNHAKDYTSSINKEVNLVLEWTHPSPLSRKPFTCNHFKLANDYLLKNDLKEIKWI